MGMIEGMRACGYLWLLFFVYWMIVALRTKRAAVRVSWRRGLYYRIPVVLGYFLMFSKVPLTQWLDDRIIPRTQVIAVVAIAITLAGLAFAVWARVYLGTNWSSAPMIKQQHQLIRSGPYRFVRHPIYSGILLAMVGTFLANGKVRGALAVLLVWFAWSVKSRIEEQFMVQTFGAEYEEYRRTTGALFPRLLG